MNGSSKVRIDTLVGNSSQDPFQYDLIEYSSGLSITPNKPHISLSHIYRAYVVGVALYMHAMFGNEKILWINDEHYDE